MLGVVFGVGSVVAMLAVGEGASAEALEQIRRLGSNNIIITTIRPVEEGVGASSPSFMSIYGLLYEDETRIRKSFSSVEHTVPVKLIRKESRLGDKRLELRVVGTVPDWFQLVRRPIVAGRVIREEDIEGRAGVVVLTEFGARRLLATEHTIGQLLRIGGEYFEVIGIVQSEEASAGGVQTPDEEVDAYAPLNVVRERFGDIYSRRTAGSRIRELVELHQLIVQVRSVEEVEAVAAGIDHMLERSRRRKDYQMSVPLALLRQAEATKRTFNIVLGSIAGISLLVGGIGIMNIMLASVTERTREIGIRRAIGAKRMQIVGQFLVETIVLSMIGGLIGVAVGILIPALITYFAGMHTIVSPQSIFLSVGISMAVGIVFGIYPAIRASNLDPIVALRHE
ncbi:MAG: FtsX-like permease family protein [Phycisphaerales bacterium]|nr:FtsX-like permease family protein [Phycisphaerales bacterium]